MCSLLPPVLITFRTNTIHGSMKIIIPKDSYPPTHIKSSTCWSATSDKGTILEDSVSLVLLDITFLWSFSTILTFDILGPGDNSCIFKDITANLSHRDLAH